MSKESDCHSSQSFSNIAYVARTSEPSKTQQAFSDDCDYAVIGDDSIKLSSDKAEYNVLNAKDKDQHDNDMSHSHVKQSLTPLVNKSHVAHNNDDDIGKHCDTESNDRSVGTAISHIDKAIQPNFPYETDDELDVDYDHAQSGTAGDFRKSEEQYSHLHKPGESCYDLDKDGKIRVEIIRHEEANKTTTADDTSGEDNSSMSHDYYILQKEETP